MTLLLLKGGGPGLTVPSDDEDSTGEDSAHPITLSPSAVVDQWGLYLMVDETGDESEAGSEGDTGFSGSAQTSIMSGLRNADFAHGPADSGAIIDDSNPLPSWSFIRVSGGSIDARWVDDTAAPAGKAIEWTVTNAVAADEAYFEQIMPIAPRVHVKAPLCVVGAGSASVPDVYSTLYAQPLDAAGVATGTAWDDATVLFGGGATTISGIVGLPDDARYLRVRFGVKAVSGVAGAYTRDVRELWAGVPRTIDVTLTGSDTTLPATGSQNFFPDAGNTNGHPAQAALRLIAPARGWVSSTSAILHDTLLGGDINVSVRNTTAGDSPGDPASIVVGTTAGYATSIYDASSNSITPGDALRFQTTVSSGTITSTGRDLHVIAVLTFVIPGAT